MDRLKHQFLELLLSEGVLTFGDFLTKSGRRSPYFFNTGRFRSGRAMDIVGDCYAKFIQSSLSQKQLNLFGPAYKGIPLCVATSMHLARNGSPDTTFTFNRKESKDHGEGGNLIGHRYDGSENVVIIEDVITGGTSIRESVAILKPFKVKILAAVVGVDRQEHGLSKQNAAQEIEKEFGIPVLPILNLETILQELSARDILGKRWIDSETLKRTQDYRSKYS